METWKKTTLLWNDGRKERQKDSPLSAFISSPQAITAFRLDVVASFHTALFKQCNYGHYV